MYRMGNRLLCSSLPETPSEEKTCACGGRCQCGGQCRCKDGQCACGCHKQGDIPAEVANPMPMDTTALMFLFLFEGGFSHMTDLMRDICPYIAPGEQERILQLLELRAAADQMKSTLAVKQSMCKSEGCRVLSRHERTLGLMRTLSQYSAQPVKPAFSGMERAFAMQQGFEKAMRGMQEGNKSNPFEMMGAMEGMFPKGTMPDMSKISSMMKMAQMFSTMAAQEGVKN